MLCVGELHLPATPTLNHNLKLPSLNKIQDQAGPSTPLQSNRHVMFDLTPAPINLTPNQHDSPWLNSPSDARPSSSYIPFAPDNISDSTEIFDYVFQSPFTLSRPPGSAQSQQKSITTPNSPLHPHRNHGCKDHSPRAGPHSPNQQSQSPSGPAGNQHGKETSDVQPFFSDESKTDRRICKLCQ